MRRLPSRLAAVLARLAGLALVVSACDETAAKPAGATPQDAVVATDGAGLDGAGDAGPARADLAWDVTQKGPYKVGFRTWSHTYLPRGEATQRTIALSLWYPTDATQGDPGKYLGLFEDPLVLADVPPAAPVVPAGHPVHVFSHGHQGYGGSSPHLARHFASHGWLVIAPDHTGNTLPDGGTRGPSIYWRRMTDVSASLDALADLPAGDPLHAKARTDKVLLSGHSFGCFNVLAAAGAKLDLAAVEKACQTTWAQPDEPCTPAVLARFAEDWREPRVVAALPMASSVGDAQLFGPQGLPKLAVPTLAMTGSLDPGHEGAPVWPWLQGAAKTSGVWVAWLDVQGACHQTFGLGDCAKPGLPQDKGPPIVAAYALALGRRHVLGDQGPQVQGILAGKVQVAAEAVLAQ